MADEEINQSDEQLDNEEQTVIIETKGRWQPFEAMTGQTFEDGKTYEISVQGNCQFAISKDKPSYGFGSTKITYTKDREQTLWIYTR